MLRLRTWGAIALILLGAACGDDSDADDGPAPTLVVATYNAGRARSFVDYAVERTEPVAEALGAETLAVLCLQEAWEEEDWEDLAAATGLTHSHRLDPDTGDEADAGAVMTCTQEEVDPLEACVRAQCDVPPGELTSCALGMCGDEVGAVSTECLSCITGVIGDVDIDAVVAACGPGGTGGASTWVFGGSFGTGLLSALPLLDTDALVLDSTATRRAVLHATVEAEDGEPLHLFCTHLSADLESVPYTGEADSWAEENRAQIEAMLGYIEERAGDERFLLLGDLNTGPPLEGIVAELADNYALLADLENPYAAQDDVQCSFCADNSLVSDGADESDSVLIDHGMLGSWPEASVQGERFLDGTITIEVEGQDIETALSDHYGVKLTIEY